MDEDTGLKSHRYRKEHKEIRELERKERDREKNIERESRYDAKRVNCLKSI